MKWTIRVVPDAEVEFEASARWYDERTALRTEFIAAIDEAVFSIAEAPLRNPLWRSGSAYRKYVVRRFPYVVFYRVRDDYVEIWPLHTRDDVLATGRIGGDGPAGDNGVRRVRFDLLYGQLHDVRAMR